MLFYVLIVLVHFFISPLLAADRCGRLNETQLYTTNKIAQLDEYPWMGAVGYDTTFHLSCTAVLINKRHAILPARCVEDENDGVLLVLFGDWLSEVKTKECKSFPECVSPHWLYIIEELAIHPEYQYVRRVQIFHNLAVAKLNKDVQFSKYVQPLCLPPAHKLDEDYVGQRLHLVGTAISENFSGCTGGNLRRKQQPQVISPSHCLSEIGFSNFTLASEQMCGLVTDDCYIDTGSILMGINVVNRKPLNFYLIGIESIRTIVSHKTQQMRTIFTRIGAYSDWILRNSDSYI